MTTIADLKEFASQVAKLLNDETVPTQDSIESSKTTLTHLLKMSHALMSGAKSPEYTELYLNDIRVAAIGYVMSMLHLLQQHGQVTSGELTPVRNLLSAVTSHYVDQSLILKEAILRTGGGKSDEEIPN